MTVTIKERGDEYTLYETQYGDLRVRDAALVKDVLPGYLPVRDLWNAFEEATGWRWDGWGDGLLSSSGRDALFLAYMTALGVLPGDIGWCAHCAKADWDDDLTEGTRDGYVCDDCAEEAYSSCPCCNDQLLTSTLETDGSRTLDDELVCQQCIRHNYSFCAECDGYYRDDDANDHAHEDDDEEDDHMDCCESPQPEFSIRNGSALLANDEKLTVGLPNRIDNVGIEKIRQLFYARYCEDRDANRLFHRLAYYLMDDLDTEWQTKAGNWPKRLSKLAYDELKLKVPPSVMTEIGNIARNHSTSGELSVAVTRDLNLPASAFYHDDSCWWGSEGAGRCALKTSGGFGLRSFGSWGSVSGRAWVMPLKYEGSQLVPTFETERPAALMVFNGYGGLSGYVPARILAQMYGWTYKKIGFSCSPMWVNGGTGYLAGKEETVRPVSELRFSLYQHSDLYEYERQEKIRHELEEMAERARRAEAAALSHDSEVTGAETGKETAHVS